MQRRTAPLSRWFWLRLIILLPLALAGQSVDRLFAMPDEAESIRAYLEVVGILYSVLTAFIAVAVWNRFSDTVAATKREATELRELWHYVSYGSDTHGRDEVRAAIERYRDCVIGDEWRAMERNKSVLEAEDDFMAMSRAVDKLTLKVARDIPTWTEAARALAAVRDARRERLHLAAERLPYPLRLLLYLVTLSVLFGILLLPFQSLVTSSIIVAAIVILLLLVLEVIEDIDNPFGGVWGLSKDPYLHLWFGPGRPPEHVAGSKKK